MSVYISIAITLAITIVSTIIAQNTTGAVQQFAGLVAIISSFILIISIWGSKDD